MKNIYIVASPFQLISAIEARHKFKGDGDTFVIYLNTNQLQTAFLKRIVNSFLDIDVIYVEYKSRRNSVAEKVKLLKKLRRTQFDYVFIGHYAEFFNQLYVCNLKFKDLVLLDDGTQTLVYNNDITEKSVTINCLKDRAIRNLPKAFYILANGLSLSRKVVINWFTMFDFVPKNGGGYTRHKFEYLKNKHIDYTSAVSDGKQKVYFIGSDLVRNKIVKSNEIYNALVKKIREHYAGYEFVYLPHRYEVLSDLSPLMSETDIELVQFDNILEVAFIENNVIPTQICSFYSTALYSLKLLYPQCEINFIEIDKNLLNPNFVDIVSQIEAYYKELFISIL